MKILPNIISKLNLLLFVGFSAIYSCNSLNINTNTATEQKESELRFKKTQLVQAMLNLPELQQYFQVQETLKQKELVILKNSCVDGIDSNLVFRLPIKLLNESEILNDSIKAFIEFKEINLKNDSQISIATLRIRDSENDTSNKSFINIGDSIVGIAYFEQETAWGNYNPIPNEDKSTNIKIRIKDIYGNNFYFKYKLKYMDLEKAREYNSNFGNIESITTYY